MHRGILLFFWVAASIAAQSKPTTETRPESQPVSTDSSAFAPLFRYCPAQVESVMCIDGAGLPQEVRSLVDLSGATLQGQREVKCKRALHAGRKFAVRGDFEGLRVFELETPVASLNSILNEDLYTYEKIAGAACFVQKRGDDEEWAGPLENWVTLVDKKYVVFATRRALMKDVLAAQGPTPEAVLDKLGCKSGEVNWAAPILIVRKYDPTSKQDPISPFSKYGGQFMPRGFEMTRGFEIERFVFAGNPAKRTGRLEVVTKDPASTLKYFRELGGDMRAHGAQAASEWGISIDPADSHGDRHAFTVKLSWQEDYTWMVESFVHQLFGVWAGM